VSGRCGRRSGIEGEAGAAFWTWSRSRSRTRGGGEGREVWKLFYVGDRDGDVFVGLILVVSLDDEMEKD